MVSMVSLHRGDTGLGLESYKMEQSLTCCYDEALATTDDDDDDVKSKMLS